jgi:dTMP kinase
MDMTGLWIAIDGPGGAGKTTTAAVLADLLGAAGHDVYHAGQPSRTPFGAYVRHALEVFDGYPLACIIAADRYQQVHDEITPALAAGRTVVCDRYVASAALDLLRGVPEDVIWPIHASLPAPDLAVMLSADAHVIDGRLAARGPHSRWQIDGDNTRREIAAYSTVAEHLTRAGWPVKHIDTGGVNPRAVAREVMAWIQRPGRLM